MPISDLGEVVSSGAAVSGPTLLSPVEYVPMPIAVGELHPAAGDGRLRITAGTEGDDRIVLDGGFAVGGAGDDTFVLTSTHSEAGQLEHLGTILDFQAGDKLDLSQLGDKAVELGREADASGGQRVTIDYDGDGKADGYVVLHENGTPAADDSGVVSPGDGEFHILPYPMPGDDGVFTIQPYPMPGDDGVFTIQPFPMPGDGEVVALRVMTGFTVSADWVV